MTQLLLKTILVLLLTFFTFFGIFSGMHAPVSRWDELTNLEVVEETTVRKSFPVLYYNNRPFFEKPPLWYTLNLLLTGSEATIVRMRVISIISALLIIALSVAFVWRRFGFLAGIVTWIMLLSAQQLFVKHPGGIFSSHTLISADADSLQILFMLIAFFAVFLKHKRAYVVVGIATALAVLAKGPLGFVTIAALTLLRQKNIGVTWLIALSLILPWYIYMFTLFGQEFLESHFLYHVVYRAVFPLEGHNGPPWYYLKILINPSVYPLFPLALLSLLLLKKISPLPFIIRYCGLIALLLFIIPSLMGTKLAWYLLPLYPFLALFTGMVIGYFKLSFSLIEDMHGIIGKRAVRKPRSMTVSED